MAYKPNPYAIMNQLGTPEGAAAQWDPVFQNILGGISNPSLVQDANRKPTNYGQRVTTPGMTGYNVAASYLNANPGMSTLDYFKSGPGASTLSKSRYGAPPALAATAPTQATQPAGGGWLNSGSGDPGFRNRAAQYGVAGSNMMPGYVDPTAPDINTVSIPYYNRDRTPYDPPSGGSGPSRTTLNPLSGGSFGVSRSDPSAVTVNQAQRDQTGGVYSSTGGTVSNPTWPTYSPTGRTGSTSTDRDRYSQPAVIPTGGGGNTGGGNTGSNTGSSGGGNAPPPITDNPYATQILGTQIPQWITQFLTGRLPSDQQKYDNSNQQLSTFFSGNNPVGQLYSMLMAGNSPWNQMAGSPLNNQMNGAMNNLSPYWQSMANNVNYLSQYGLPGTQQLQGEQQSMGNSANAMLGSDGGYGLQDFYSQILQGGLPNQSSIEGLVNPQIQASNNQTQQGQNILGSLSQGQNPTLSPFQQNLQNTLGGYINGAGLTPEFVKAQRELVLNPSKEALYGDLNQMAGGEAMLTSPAYQEQIRRQEEGFNNQLISQGFNNLQGFMGLGNQAGGQNFNQGLNLAGAYQQGGQNAYGNALSAYGIVPQSVSPFTGQMGNLTSDLYGQSLNRYNVGNSLGLQNLSTINNIAQTPYNMSQSANTNLGNQYMNLLNSMMGGQLNFNDQNLRLLLGESGQLGNLAQTGMQGNYDLARTGMMTNSQNSQAMMKAIGQAIAMMIGGG